MKEIQETFEEVTERDSSSMVKELRAECAKKKLSKNHNVKVKHFPRLFPIRI